MCASVAYVVGREELVELLQRDDVALAGLAGVADLHLGGALAQVADLAGGEVEAAADALQRSDDDGVRDVGRAGDSEEDLWLEKVGNFEMGFPCLLTEQCGEW